MKILNLGIKLTFSPFLVEFTRIRPMHKQLVYASSLNSKKSPAL